MDRKGRINKNKDPAQSKESDALVSNTELQGQPSKLAIADISNAKQDGDTSPAQPSPLLVVQKANRMMGKEAKPLPVTVLSGFLGAGKTTMLTHLLQNRAGVRIAVVVNDMASINVDAELVRQGGVLKQEEKMIELSNGCICCTLREDLLTSLAGLAAEQRFDHVLVESSGISEPLPVAETFTFADENSGASLSDVANLSNLVTVVDAASLLDQFASVDSLVDRGWEATEGDQRSVAGLLVDQLEFSDVLVINKADLLPAQQLGTVHALLRRLNPTAEIMQTEFGCVAPELLFGKARFNMQQAEAHPHWLKEARVSEHTPETIEFGISSFVFRAKRPFHPQRLHLALGSRPRAGPLGRLLRIKGIAWLATGAEKQASVMFGQLALAGTQFSVVPMGLWWASAPPEDLPEGLDADIQALWKEKPFARQTEVVCIGQELDHTAATEALELCLLSEQEMAAGAAAWSRQPVPVADLNVEALMLAAETGKLKVIRFLVEKVKTDINVATKDGSTALIAAALNGHLEATKWLVEEGRADPLAKKKDGTTAMMSAVSNGHLEIAKWLVEHGTADTNARKKDGSTAVMLAALKGHFPVLQWLVEVGKADPNASKKDGWTALMAAALNGHLAVVKWLVEEGKADPNAKKADGWTALMSAALNGHLEVAKWLVENAKADPKAVKRDSMTVLMSAASNGHLEVSKWLVEHCGNNPNATTKDDMNALMLAAQNGHLDVVRWLVEEGKADPNAEKTDGWTALMSAALNGHLHVAEWLVVDGKANPQAKKKDGWTVLMAATVNGHLEVAKWLAQKGKADPMATTNVGFTALMSAALNGHLEVARWLVVKGNANASAATSDGSTALMLAAENGHVEVAKWLVQEGRADPKATTTDGMTAPLVAAQRGHRELAEWLGHR